MERVVRLRRHVRGLEFILFYLLLFCMLHYYEVILHALVVSYIIPTKVSCSTHKFVKLTIIFYNLSKRTFFVNFLKFLLNLLMSLFLIAGQFSVRNTAAFTLFLSFSSSLQSYNMWSTVCSALLQERSALSQPRR